MTTPAIQNDFSYYRRIVTRGSSQGACEEDEEEDQLKLDSQMANKKSLFYAYPTPMLKVISEATSKFVTEVCAFNK